MSERTSQIVQGRTVTLPVEVRRVSSWAAHFLVPAGAGRRMIAHTGLEVAEPLPGRALVSIPFVRYEDSDLDAYNEVGIVVAVRTTPGRPGPSDACWRSPRDGTA